MPLRAAVTEAVNDTLKAIAASLLDGTGIGATFQLYGQRTIKSGPVDGFDYGEDGYDPRERQMLASTLIVASSRLKLKDLSEPKSKEAASDL